MPRRVTTHRQTEGLKTALRRGNPSRTLSVCPSFPGPPAITQGGSRARGPSRGLTPDSQGEGLRLSNPCPRPRGFTHPGVPARSWVLVRRCCRTCSRRRACPGSGRRPRQPRRRGREGRGRWGPRAGRERLPEGAWLRAAPRGLRAQGCVYRDWQGCHLHAVTERGRSRVKAQTQGDPAAGFLPARFRSPEVPPQAPGTPRPRSRAAGSWSAGGGQRAARSTSPGSRGPPRVPGGFSSPRQGRRRSAWEACRWEGRSFWKGRLKIEEPDGARPQPGRAGHRGHRGRGWLQDQPCSRQVPSAPCLHTGTWGREL